MATYALLVGIDEYLGAVQPLHGCVADVSAIGKLLAERIPGASIRTLTNAEATRDGVIRAFGDHLGAAQSGDTAIFFYAGHGSQAKSASPAGVEPDGMDETLVLYDSRTPSRYDLVDKELGALIAGIARVGVHVFVGLDCCHSGSGTRDVLPDGMTVRRTATDLRSRSVTTYLGEAGRTTTPGGSGWTVGGRHVLLAACRSDQTAKEFPVAGQPRGALSAAVEQALRGGGPAQTYRDLLVMVRSALAMQSVPDQVPQLEVTNDGDDLGAVFDGNVVDRPPHFVAAFLVADRHWTIDGGAVHGIPQRDFAQTRLAIYPLDAPLDGTWTPVATSGIAQVSPQSCVLTVPTPTAFSKELDPLRAYAAVITAWPLPRVPVVVTSEAGSAAAQAVRDRINSSPLLSVAGVGDLTVQLTGASTSIIDRTRGSAPVAVWSVPDSTMAVDPGVVAASVEQIVRYRQVLALENPGSSLTPETIRLEINASENAVRRPGEVTFPYISSGTKWQPQRFTVTVRNVSDRPVWCALLAFGEDYSITGSLLPGNVAHLQPHQEKVSVGITAAVPDDVWDAGALRRIDIIKLMVSTEQFDPMLSVQRGLPHPALDVSRSDRDAVTPNTLNRLLRRVQERELLPDPGDDEPIVDWATQSVTIISERPRPSVDLGQDVRLAPGVRLRAPDGVAGRITVTSLDLTSRDAFVPLVPPMLIDQPEIWASFAFQAERGGSAPLDVLELRDVQNPELVTPDRPIIVELDAARPVGESVLVIGFDGTNYLPVGRSVADGSGAIRIEQLPPSVEGRSLKGSIRLLFRRLLHEARRQPAVETRLAIATVDATGAVQYDDDADHVQAAVTAATQVLLLVHGILGDTAGMVLGSATPAATGGRPFGSGYDLVLAFDYENINTPVSITAASLLSKLHTAGFDGSPGRSLDVVAHSMGGLVTRWMIELLGGADIVRRLVTAGTPNNGSPWPVVQDWAIVALSFGLNQLAQVFWPAAIAAQLVRMVEKVDGALDDMAPDSERLKSLFVAPDPDVDYHVLIGNRALAVPLSDGGRISKLLGALKRKSIDVGTDLIFFGQINDLAVSVDSALHLPAGRSPVPVVVQGVECDHVTYFSSSDGLAKISQALA